MSDIQLTAGSDQFEFTNANDTIYRVSGLQGNDTFIYKREWGWASADGGAGDDRFEKITNISEPQSFTVDYSDAPKAVRIDLRAGTAQDGWGGNDTLINIRSVHLGGKDGDQAFGSNQADFFALRSNQTGTTKVDGRQGTDTVTFWGSKLADFKVTASPVGSVQLRQGGYTIELESIERIEFNSENFRQTHVVTDLIDISSLGVLTLIAQSSKAWAAQKSGATNLSFSFMAAAPSYDGWENPSSFQPPSATYEQAVRAILGHLSSQTGLTFTEVKDSASSFGQLRFGVNQQTNTKGQSFGPEITDKDKAGDIWLDLETTQALRPGEEGWALLLQKIGAALGLLTPRAKGSGGSGQTELLDIWNHHGFTVMSDNASPTGLWPSWFGILDIQALQHLYGSASTSSSKPQSHLVTLGDALGNTLAPIILSSDRNHVLDASSSSTGVLLDLRAGKASSAGLGDQGSPIGNLTLEASARVESAIGSNSDDVLIGNSLNNTFWPQYGNDVIDGNGARNTVVIPGSVNQYSISAAVKPNAFFVDALDGVSGSKQVTNVQTLRFDDAQVSLPSMVKVASTPLPAPVPGAGLQTLNLLEFSALPTPDWASNPGAQEGSSSGVPQARFQAASMITVAFGADSIGPLLDLGVSFYSAGMRHADVAKLISDNQIIESLLGTSEAGAWINHVYSNVVGAPPPPTVQADFVDLLSSNQFSRAGLLDLAAGLTPLIEQQASLVGFSLLQ